ncbi:MAG: MaoC family dehydratase N-terminal domain-containing protein [Pseudomonadota bacterium]
MDDFIGRTQRIRDRIDPWKAAALHDTLDLDAPAPGPGQPLPNFWHWIYFLESRPLRELGRDGHPLKGGGGFMPDLGLPRRMWAGSRLTFHRPLSIGAEAERAATIANVERKEGRTGPLAFVTVRYEISDSDGLALTEEQDIVYREDPKPGDPAKAPAAAPTDEHRSRRVDYTSTKLFRYSALTFNGHRIHYDREYATGVEGYAGLITHGPLIAQEMLGFGEAEPGRRAKSYSYRALSPAFDFEALEFCAKDDDDGADLWTRGPDGRLVMKGRIEFA